MTDLIERVEWHLRTQLDRPSAYGKRIVLDAADVQALLDLAKKDKGV